MEFIANWTRIYDICLWGAQHASFQYNALYGLYTKSDKTGFLWALLVSLMVGELIYQPKWSWPVSATPPLYLLDCAIHQQCAEFPRYQMHVQQCVVPEQFSMLAQSRLRSEVLSGYRVHSQFRRFLHLLFHSVFNTVHSMGRNPSFLKCNTTWFQA